MRKIALTMAGAALCAMAPSAAIAQSTVSTISGTLVVQKGNGPVLSCNATIGLDGASPETSNNVTSISLTGGGILQLCTTVQFPNVPHSIVQSGGDFDVIDVYADTTITAGDCFGDLEGTVSGGVVTLNASLPEVDPGTGDCTVSGSLS